MAATRNPPTSGEELLARFATGERMFQHAELHGAQLRHVDLSRVNLYAANLACADLSYANLRAANLSSTDLRGAHLYGANLFDVNLFSAHLEGADLRAAELYGADLTGAHLHDALVDGLTLGSTNLLDLDLSPLCEATSTIRHEEPSRIDHTSILRSIHAPRLREFLQRTGMPEIFIEYMIDCARALSPGGVFRMLQSTFISYGAPDTDFAQKLNDALIKNGVTTFFFAKDAVPGRKLHRLMRDGVNQHDRVILVCSQVSLERSGVLNEIDETLQREARDGGKEYLIPVTLDHFVFSDWKPEDPGIAQAIRDRVVADFKGADKDQGKFNDGLLRLIAALKK